MGQSKLRGIKGHRPLHDVQVDFTNICAAFGAAQYRRVTLEKDILGLRKRLDELQQELGAAERSEKEKQGIKVDLPATPLVEAPAMDKNGNEYVPCTTEECLAADLTHIPGN